MIDAMLHAIEAPPDGERVAGVPEIRGGPVHRAMNDR
jgi:hypothetical protein